MNKTKIEWCDVTLNPVVGCTYNCEYCYARKMNQRFNWIDDFHKPQFFPDRLKKLESKKPQVVFMNSLSDIADWEKEWVKEVFAACEENPQHTYLFLTKRVASFVRTNKETKKPNKLLIGETITTQKAVENCIYIPDFLSIEPILEPINLKNGIVPLCLTEWVIIGAETGNRKSKVVPKKEWIDSIVRQCETFNIPVFMKNSLIPIVGEENMRREFPWEVNNCKN